MNPDVASDFESRLRDRALKWRVSIERSIHTESSVVAFGHRDEQPVILKVIKHRGDEWFSGKMLEAFGGRGVVRALQFTDGAVLLERLLPGESLVAAEEMNDDEATAILADVIGQMCPGPPPGNAPTVEVWSKGFERYLATGTTVIPRSLVEVAHGTYSNLCASQGVTRLLHGDLHHYNVLRDMQRGWVTIDPKGVVGELAHELGAALRNPYERPELYAAPVTIGKRVDYFGRALGLDTERILGWAFAQSVLAAIWELEDHGAIDAGAGWICLANSIRPMLPGRLIA